MKRISPATVTFGVMAIVLGLVAAYIVRQSMPKPPVVQRPIPRPPAPAPPPDLVPVAFAGKNIPKHGRITASDVFIGYVGKSAKAATGTFRSTAIAEGRITSQSIRAGQAIRDEYLLGIGEPLPDLAARLPAGHRAVTVEMLGADTGGKRLEEGDHIDIAMAVSGTHPEMGELLTRTLLRNVLVVDAMFDTPIENGKRVNPSRHLPTITVAVAPADANKLLVAERTGTLIATLVSDQDVLAGNAPSSPDSITRRQLLGLKDPIPLRKFTVEKWSGSQMKLLEMNDDRIRESREATSGRREDPVETTPLDPRHTYIPSGVNSPLAKSEAIEAQNAGK